MKRSIAVTALCVLVLSGCAGQTDTVGPAAEEAGKVNPQLQALEQAEQAVKASMTRESMKVVIDPWME